MKDDAERARAAVETGTGGRFKTLGDFTEALLSEDDPATQDTLIGEAATLLHHLAAFAQQPEGWVLVSREPTPEIIAAILPKVSNPTDADRDVAAKALDVLGAEFEPVGMIVAAELVRDYRAMLAAATMLGAERCA